MSSDQNVGYVLYIGDEKLPSYIGIIISHYRDPYKPTSNGTSLNFSNGVKEMAEGLL